MKGVPEPPNGAGSVWWPYLYSAAVLLLLTWEWEIQAGSSFIKPTGHPWSLPLSPPCLLTNRMPQVPFNTVPEINWPDVAQLLSVARQKVLAWLCSSNKITCESLVHDRRLAPSVPANLQGKSVAWEIVPSHNCTAFREANILWGTDIRITMAVAPFSKGPGCWRTGNIFFFVLEGFFYINKQMVSSGYTTLL